MLMEDMLKYRSDGNDSTHSTTDVGRLRKPLHVIVMFSDFVINPRWVNLAWGGLLEERSEVKYR